MDVCYLMQENQIKTLKFYDLLENERYINIKAKVIIIFDKCLSANMICPKITLYPKEILLEFLENKRCVKIWINNEHCTYSVNNHIKPLYLDDLDIILSDLSKYLNEGDSL